MAKPTARGDRMAEITEEVRDALERGGMATGFVLTTTAYGEIDAYTLSRTKLEIRVEVRD